MTITVKLRNASGGTFDGITLQVSYFTPATAAGEVEVHTDAYAPSSQGAATVTLPAIQPGTSVAFILVRATGVLAQVSLDAASAATTTALTIDYDDRHIVLGASADVPEAAPVFVYGRLLDRHGIAKTDDVQIIISATRTGGSAPEPIASVRTETNGYFAIDYPAGSFVAASAEIGMDLVANPIAIPLDTSGPSPVFPRRVLLVVDPTPVPATTGTDGCDCKLIDLPDAKRVLEEFSFFSLIRTTEPEIQGYVLPEDDELTLGDVLGRHPVRANEMLDAVAKLPAFANLAGRRLAISTAAGSALAPATAPTMVTMAAAATTGEGDDLSRTLASVKIGRPVLDVFLAREGALTKDNIVGLLDLNDALRFKKTVFPVKHKSLARVVLDATHTVDWDADPTLYQAVSVAHGHLLHYKSEWLADGYSLGDVLYSLPLAPGQKKQIVVFDWERRESASNVQSVDYEESLYNSLSRDRDISEITRGVLEEASSGSSSSTTASVSAGFGGVLKGVLFGVSGGVGHASSSASQNDLRSTSASDLQKITDRIVQSGNAVRSTRSTVIQTVAQGERFEVSSESVANYNHCHAITIQYFEVLRHLKVRNRLADARECLFVPLPIARFDLAKTLRWREPLAAVLLERALAKGFDAAARVRDQWSGSNFPSGTFASEPIAAATGTLQVRFVVRRPADKLVTQTDTAHPIVVGTTVTYPTVEVEAFDADAWQSLVPFLGGATPKSLYDQYIANAKDKDAAFQTHLGDTIARAFVAQLGFHVADQTGTEIATMAFDATLASHYRQGGTLNVTLRFAGPTSFGRDHVHYLRITCAAIPDTATAVVESGFIRYHTAHYDGFLGKFSTIRDDLAPGDDVTLFVGPSGDELRDPRKDDLSLVNQLIDHLNDNLEYYHKGIWLRMSPDRRFLLLDGIVLPPGTKGGGRSLASLVENELVGVVGNSLVFPVAPGLNLDPTFGLKDSLLDYYMVAPTDPISISVPTKGVYAEAMMGTCNSCERKDESRFWRWEESPIPDSPTAIQPIDTSTRAQAVNLQPAALPAPVLALQSAPQAPDPTGLAAALTLLGNANAFRDLTGLAGNQTNALEALKQSFATTSAFGQQAATIRGKEIDEAAKLAVQQQMDKRIDTAMNLIKSSGLPAETQQSLIEKAISAYLGGGAQSDPPEKTDQQKADSAKAATDVIKDAVDKKAITEGAGQALTTSLLKQAFQGSSETTPATVDAQDLITTAGLANKDVAYEDGTFKLVAQTAAGAGGATTAAASTIPVTFVLINKLQRGTTHTAPDPVRGVTVNIAAGNISQASATTNKVSVDLSSVPNGAFTADIVPDHVYTGGVWSSIGDPTTSPPDRLWFPYTAMLTKNGATITSTDPRVSISGSTITITIAPVWMNIAAHDARGTQAISLIVVHHTDGENHATTYDNTFQDTPDAAIRGWIGDTHAPHYVIDRDGWVVKLGHETGAARQAGWSNWDGHDSVNTRSIGIEIVHTNNVDLSGHPTYTDQYTLDQYSSLVALLQDLVGAWSVPVYGVVGHSDIATDKNGNMIPGRKSGDPGKLFDWETLEAAGLGLLRDPGAVNFVTAYGGYFDAHPTGKLSAGGAGTTTAIITELKDDLAKIGYSVGTSQTFDIYLKHTIMVFCEHFRSSDGHDSVDKDTAELIKKVRAYCDQVKP